MNLHTRKPTILVFDQVGYKRPLHLQKKARTLIFSISKENGLYYPCSENKGADQLRFDFAHAYCWFSDAAAQI